MAQDDSGEKKVKLKLSGDLVSSYIFRGVLATPTPSPNFQPTLAAVAGNLEVGTWGSTDFIGSYRDVDLYATYTAAVSYTHLICAVSFEKKFFAGISNAGVSEMFV